MCLAPKLCLLSCLAVAGHAAAVDMSGLPAAGSGNRPALLLELGSAPPR